MRPTSSSESGFEPEDPQARQERGVDLEVGVLGRGADEGHDAVLDVRQQGILLGLVEAMDLIDEEDAGRATAVDPLPRPCHGGAHLLDAARRGREDVEGRVHGLRQQPCQRRLARSRRTPEHHRDEAPALDHAAQGAALADERLLAHELGQAGGAHPGRQRHVPAVGPQRQALHTDGTIRRAWHASHRGSLVRAARRPTTIW